MGNECGKIYSIPNVTHSRQELNYIVISQTLSAVVHLLKAEMKNIKILNNQAGNIKKNKNLLGKQPTKTNGSIYKPLSISLRY